MSKEIAIIFAGFDTWKKRFHPVSNILFTRSFI